MAPYEVKFTVGNETTVDLIYASVHSEKPPSFLPACGTSLVSLSEMSR